MIKEKIRRVSVTIGDFIGEEFKAEVRNVLDEIDYPSADVKEVFEEAFKRVMKTVQGN